MRWLCVSVMISLLMCIPVMRYSVEDPPEPSVESVKTIFILPMRDRMNNLLTSDLVRWGHFRITVNPKQAEAILSDTTNIDVHGLVSDPSTIRKPTSTTLGTVFLIDIKSEKVLWSTSKKPSDSWYLGGSKNTRELAAEIVDQLKKDVLNSK
jgi:hypothetical protein